MDRSTQQRERSLLLGLIVLSIVLVLLGSNAVSELAIRWLAPYNFLYPNSLLAQYHADYTHWTDGPGLAALDPRAVEAAGDSPFGRFRRGGLLEVAVPVAAPSPVIDLPSPTSSSTSVPSTATTTPLADTVTPSPSPSLTNTPSPASTSGGVQSVPTRTPSPEPSSSATREPTSTPSLPPFSTSTDTPPVATERPTGTIAPTVTTAPSSTTVPSATTAPSAMPSSTSVRPSSTTVPSATVPPTATSSPTATNSPTATDSPTATNSPTATATATATPIPTATSTPVVSFNGASQNVSEGVGQVTIPVRLNVASSQDISVPYTVDGTASNPADHDLQNGTIHFPAGSTTANLTFNVVQDTIDEPDETVVVTLGSAAGIGVGSPRTYTVTIADDDPPRVQFSSATYNVQEKIGGSTAIFTATLSSEYTDTVLVDYETIDGGTATAGSDYIASTGTLTFTAGQTIRTFTVPIKDDDVYENNETVKLQLINPRNATLGTQSTATLTISDNETQPTVQFGQPNYSIVEGNVTATITTILSGQSATNVSVNYATSDGTATAGSDYIKSTGTLTFTAGQTTQTFTISIRDDNIYEGAETINVALSRPTGATLGAQSTATLTIIDNDQQPTVQFDQANYRVVEGDTATITVELSNPSASKVIATYTTNDGTADSNDYIPVSGTLTFLPLEMTKTFTVTTKDDDVYEAPETIRLALSGLSGAAPGAQQNAVLTITDNDVVPTVQFSSPTYSVNEKTGGSTATITATLTGNPFSGNPLLPVTVNYATSDGTAKDGSDYTASSGQLTFTSTSRVATFTVPILDDKVYDDGETINLTLSNPSLPVVLGTPSTATLTIVDDEPKPTVSFSTSSYSVDEGNPRGMPITVLLSAASEMTTTVTWSTLPNSPVNTTLVPATPGADYTEVTSKTLLFAPGQTSATFIAPIIDDNVPDGGGDTPRNEVFGLQLASPSGADLGSPSSAQIVIVDDDPIPSGCDKIAATEVITFSQTPEIQKHDNQAITIGCGRSTIVDLESTPIRTNNSSSPDFTYYETEYHSGTIAMDWTIIQVAESLNGPWYTVLYWGDDLPDDNTDLGKYWDPNTTPHEKDNLEIGDDSTTNGLNIPVNGIRIDIDAKAPPGKYRYIKFISPRSGDTDAVDVDAVIIPQ